MDRQELCMLFAPLMSTGHIGPHVSIRWQSMWGVARKRIPPLILVNVIVVRICHRVHTRFTRLHSFHKGSTPASSVHPSGVIVANAPRYARSASFNASQMATHLPPEHVVQRDHYRRTAIPNREEFNAATNVQAVHSLGRHAMNEQAEFGVIDENPIAVWFGTVETIHTFWLALIFE